MYSKYVVRGKAILYYIFDETLNYIFICAKSNMNCSVDKV